VFHRASGGGWSFDAYVKASNTGADDNFGRAIAVSGDALGITAIGEASDATGIDGVQSSDVMPFAGASYAFH
jgi:hypothetical protein